MTTRRKPLAPYLNKDRLSCSSQSEFANHQVVSACSRAGDGCRGGSARSRQIHHSPQWAPSHGEGAVWDGRGWVHVLVGVQVPVIFMLMLNVHAFCFCMFLLFYSGSLQRERKERKTWCLNISGTWNFSAQTHTCCPKAIIIPKPDLDFWVKAFN